MFRSILYAQWKATRWLLAPLTILCFAAPLAAVTVSLRLAQGYGLVLPEVVLDFFVRFLGGFPALALITGLAAAASAWQWDHAAGHVYALALPLSRARYALLRLAAGALLLSLPVTAFWVSSFLAAWTTTLPEGLHAYPFSFGFRFLLATLISYVTLFALAAGTPRTAVRVIGGLVVFVVLGTFLVGFAEDVFDRRGLLTPFDLLNRALLVWPGPFHVFGGSWMLIDV